MRFFQNGHLTLGLGALALISLLVYFFSSDVLPHFQRMSLTTQVVTFFVLNVVLSISTIPLGIVAKVLAGFLFGFLPGTLIAHLSIVVGSLVAFFYARYFFKGYTGKIFPRFSSTKWRTVDILCLRLLPVFPLQLTNMALGTTSVKASTFFWGSLIGMLPASMAYAYLGQSLGENEVMSFKGNLGIIFYVVVVFIAAGLWQFARPNKYRLELEPILKSIFSQRAKHAWDEQALPSYLSHISVLACVFWKRITLSLKVAGANPHGVVFDFGCGVGACLPWLSRNYAKVYAWDLDDHARKGASQLIKELQLKNVEFIDVSEERFILQNHSLDVIIALDVLEHVEQLPKTLREFERILKPGGKLVVCSPTENWIYRFARLFAPKGYKGEFHKRAAREVENDLANHFQVSLMRRIFPIATFFRIVVAKKSMV